MNNIDSELKALRIEDIIWYTYIFIAIFALVSNYFEKNFVRNKDKHSYDSYHNINIGIFITTTIIYLYFIYRAYLNYQKRPNLLNKLNLLAALLILIAGLIYLYTTYKDSYELEIAI